VCSDALVHHPKGMTRASVLLVVAAAAVLLAPRPANGADEKQQCLAASDQGQQFRDDGNYRRGREAFAQCARDVCPALVRHDCLKWLADLEQSYPSVVVGAKNDKGDDLIDVTVLIDGAALMSKLDGKPTLVDPGAHVLRFETAGYPPVEQRLVVHAGEKNRLLVAQFGTPAPPTSGAPAPPPTTVVPLPATPIDSGPPSHGTRPLAWVLGGVAVAAFGVEAYFGVTGLSDRNTLKAQPCAQTATCSGSAVDSIRTKFLVSDVALGVGAVSAAVAIYLFVAPQKDPAPARSSAGSGSGWSISNIDVVSVPGGAAMGMTGRF
jgi:hypothetical protein